MNEAAQRLQTALRLLRQRLDMSDAEGDVWLANETAHDPALHADVQRLLAADRAASGPLDTPLAQHIAQSHDVADEGADARIGQRIGPYLLRELLGRGGMGSVYLAERVDGIFEQTVALKLLRHADAEPQTRRRFARERQILVRLQHPNIARFLDGGVTADDQPWYAMEAVQGEPLTHHAQRIGATLAQRINLMLQVCDAVQFAHAALVLHRDLKPANILADAQGQVKLLDFGIAKLIASEADTERDATVAEQRVFTPDYASPEQLRGELVGTATDIYALGVVLYELLTDSRPFQRQRVTALATMETDAEPPSRRLAARGERQRGSRLRGDLDTIVATCLNPDPARRYASAAALKRDLERHLAGLPIEARPDAFGYRAGKFVQRHRFGVAAGLLLAAALIAATAISLTQARRAESESARATVLAASLQRERDAALDEIRRQDMLREHFVAVLNRATESGEPIEPAQLLALAGDPNLLGEFGDPSMRRALTLTLTDLAMQRSNYPRALELLDELDADRDRLDRAGHPPRDVALADANRAIASVRVGKLDEALAAIERAEAAMTPEQREGGMLPARLATVLGQIQRARGDVAAAIVTTHRAAALARDARDGSPLDRGAAVGSAAIALLQLGELDDALRYANRADAIWRDAGVTVNISTRTVASVRSNVLFLRGNLRDALAALRADNSAALASESVPARAARDATEAKTLALLAHPADALALADAAQAAMCRSVGPDSLDCLRVRLSAVDTRTIAGDLAGAARELDEVRTILALQPVTPLQSSADGFQAMIELLDAPDAERLATLQSHLTQAAERGGLASRNVVRALLMAAERLHAAGNSDLAADAARTALTLTPAPNEPVGMDASLLALWQARLAMQPPPETALRALSDAIGPEHPWVRMHSASGTKAP